MGHECTRGRRGASPLKIRRWGANISEGNRIRVSTRQYPFSTQNQGKRVQNGAKHRNPWNPEDAPNPLKIGNYAKFSGDSIVHSASVLTRSPGFESWSGHLDPL